MTNEFKNILTLCLTALFLLGGAISCTAYESRLVANSPDPMATRCALQLDTAHSPICAIVATQRAKP